MKHYDYTFVTLETTPGTGYSFFGGIRTGTEGHRAMILEKAREGWRYVGYVPTVQDGEGRMVEMDLIFEREHQEAVP